MFLINIGMGMYFLEKKCINRSVFVGKIYEWALISKI